MRNKIIGLLILVIVLAGCSNKGSKKTDGQAGGLEKYEYTFFDTFDTIISYVAFEESEEKFNEDAAFVESEFKRLHKIYDNYNTYTGINNVMSINENAGKGPIEVDKELSDLVALSIKWNKDISPKVDISLGPVLKIWHDYREEAMANPDRAAVPSGAELEKADEFVDIKKIKVNEKKRTVEIQEGMSIDLGAVAKGYAVELVTKSLEERGVKSAILSAGGNVKLIGSPMDGSRDKWGIGIQNPDAAKGLSAEQLADVLYLKEGSAVTSGDYQRYYEVDGNFYHHIIDPDTLEPPNFYNSVTIVAEDSGLADFLSTAAFLLPMDESEKLIKAHKGAEALWILEDNTIVATDGLKPYMESLGASPSN